MSINSKTILLIDDHPEFRAIIAEILNLHGYEVKEAALGAEALNILDAGFAPFCIVTDFHMPGMNGIDLARAVRVKYRIPILLCTTDDRVLDLIDGIADLFVVDKDFEAILASIDRLAPRPRDDLSAFSET